MVTKNLSTVNSRVSEASKILGIGDSSKLSSFLKVIGVDDGETGLKLLNSGICTIEYLEGVISGEFNTIGVMLIKVAVQYLKGNDPFDNNPKNILVEKENNEASTLLEYIRVNKPITQMRDDELITLWSNHRDSEVENELHKRSKGQAFIVLKAGTQIPGKEAIDIEYTLEMLRSARKRTNPTIIPYLDNTYATVYRISELNLNDRVIELCPLCGEILWKGYCAECDSNFAGIGDDERAYVKLIVESGKINNKTASDRKAVVVSAAKGIDDLKCTWPGIIKEFEELRLTGNLPKLRKIANRPSKAPADPFHVSGNRQF
jgi:hypothetical protein